MSEVINLIDGNPDVHVYLDAVNILKEKLKDDYSFVLQLWNGEIPKNTKHKKILILTSDEHHGVPNQVNDEGVHHIFKQYAPMQNRAVPSTTLDIKNVSALPLCHLEGHTRQDFKPLRHRELVWSWAGQHDPYARNRFKTQIEMLQRYSDERSIPYECLWYKGWNNGMPISEYSKMVNNTKIMFVPQGSASLETFRFFEAMMSGCIVLTFNDLPHGSVYDYYNSTLQNLKKYIQPHFSPFGVKNISMMKALVDWVGSNPDKAQEMSVDAMKWYDMMCSPEGLSEYMIQELENKNV